MPEPLQGVLERALWPTSELRTPSAAELFEALAATVEPLRGR